MPNTVLRFSYEKINLMNTTHNASNLCSAHGLKCVEKADSDNPRG